MTTPMIMLGLMVAPLAFAGLFAAATRRALDPRGPAAVGLALLFLFTAMGHFVKTGPMSQMLPSFVPERVLLVYVTGLLEIAIAAGFLMQRSRYVAGCIAAVVLVMFFPANIYAAINHVPMGGHESGPAYLLIRAPVQLAILAYVYFFTIRPVKYGAVGDRRSVPGRRIGQHGTVA